jgi:hypothetical protein
MKSLFPPGDIRLFSPFPVNDAEAGLIPRHVSGLYDPRKSH